MSVQTKSDLSNLAEALTYLLRVSTGKELQRLVEEHPFLDELTAASSSERGSEMKHLKGALTEFLTNGNVFLKAVERLLLAHRYQNLAAYMATDSTLGSHFLRLLDAALKKYKRKKSLEDSGDQRYPAVDFGSILNQVQGLQLDQDLLHEIQDVVVKRSEMRTPASRITWSAIVHSHGPIHFKDSEVQHMLKTIEPKTPRISEQLFKRLVGKKNEIHRDVIESMTGGFVFVDHGYFRVWNQIGENLRQLCYLTGANIAYSTTDTPWIIPALRAAVDSRTGALAITQGIIQQQSIEIHNQQQVITSLVFRSLMEQIPPVGMDKKSATSRWQGFWDKAVKVAEAKDDERNPEHPLRGILTPQLKNRGREMYGTLSFGIHNYRDCAFLVDSTTFTALDSKILKALTPAGTSINEDGTVDWVAERKRYGVE
ncbi:hypothetical protein MGU_08265 [Metarhizium guizhouense ARSEF 977]|uniref:Uncharacterized protein n=1 Tax=Metarhizium guizhouense (strain ARSEF 977) TaxID=1276136 RepID=A0A0B4GXK2_METGA|nr:hypothetical protein MGU_08265 [Metarhizium guizhouense ARSEF 977]